MRLAILALLLVPALALAGDPHAQSVTVTLPLPVAEALASVVASRHLAGDTACTIQSLIVDILAVQAGQIAAQAVATEQLRRAAAREPALLAWKRRVAKLADEAQKAQAHP